MNNLSKFASFLDFCKFAAFFFAFSFKNKKIGSYHNFFYHVLK